MECRMNGLIISELVRIAIAQMAVPVSWEFLQSTNVTDEQLAALQRRLGNAWNFFGVKKMHWRWSA